MNEIIANLVKNAENACKVVAEAVAAHARRARLQMRLGAGPRHPHRPRQVPEATRRKLGILIDKYFV